MQRRGTVLLSTVLIFMAWGFGKAWTQGPPLQGLPSHGESVSVFVPPGWTVEEQVDGDLNGDTLSDMAVLLIQAKASSAQDATDGDLERALIVLLGHGKDGLTLAGVNDKLLQCKGCGGIKEGVSIEIKKGVIIIDQMSGSREFSDATWRFRYNPEARRFVLIGRDVETGDSVLGTGMIESCNYLTGDTITETYRYEKGGERKITVSTKRGKTSRETRPMEEVEGEMQARN